jgi:hypothetical protein
MGERWKRGERRRGKKELDKSLRATISEVNG